MLLILNNFAKESFYFIFFYIILYPLHNFTGIFEFHIKQNNKQNKNNTYLNNFF